MGFDNPIIPWRELERRLSDRVDTPPRSNGASHPDTGAPSNGAGVVRGLSSRRSGESRVPRVPHAELHAR